MDVLIAQNGPIMEKDASATLSITTCAVVELATPVPHKPAAPTNADAARCHFRSPVWSECNPTSTIAIAVTIYGNAESTPISKLLPWKLLLIRFGSHRLTPYEHVVAPKYTRVNSQTLESLNAIPTELLAALNDAASSANVCASQVFSNSSSHRASSGRSFSTNQTTPARTIAGNPSITNTHSHPAHFPAC